MEPLDDVIGELVREVGDRAVRAHAAGVRAGVEIAQALVVARGRQREGVAPIADRDEARLSTV